MAAINTYLNFNGNTEEAFNFYKSVFGGEFQTLQRMKETPDCDKLPADQQDKIMHVALPIGSNILMGTDVPPTMPAVQFGTNSSICISPDSEEEATRLFNALGEGGNIGMPLQKMFWGDLFGFFTDKFGVQWMVNYHAEQA
jgi:PhnB protein